MNKVLLGKFPPGEFAPEKFPRIKFPMENFPTKCSPGVFPPISLIIFLHLTLRFSKFSQR